VLDEVDNYEREEVEEAEDESDSDDFLPNDDEDFRADEIEDIEVSISSSEAIRQFLSFTPSASGSMNEIISGSNIDIKTEFQASRCILRSISSLVHRPSLSTSRRGLT
jgi:hypothetical protein